MDLPNTLNGALLGKISQKVGIEMDSWSNSFQIEYKLEKREHLVDIFTKISFLQQVYRGHVEN